MQFRDGGDAEVDRRYDYGSPEHLQRADQMSNIFSPIKEQHFAWESPSPRDDKTGS